MLELTKIKWLRNWIVLKELPVETKTKSGLFINPHGLQGAAGRDAEYFHAIVVGVCPTITTVKVDEHVVYDEYSGGMELMMNEEKYFLTKWQNVWAVVEEQNVEMQS